MAERRATQEAELTAGEIASMEDRRDIDLEGLPGGLPPLKTIHDDLADQLLALAEKQVAEARKLLGAQTSKPKLKRIEQMFKAKAGPAPGIGEEMVKMMRSPLVAPKTAVLDASFDRAVASAFNTYDKESIRAGAAVQSAYDDWTMAVRIYKSELRSAGATLYAQIELAVHPHTGDDYDYEEPVRGSAQIRHYTKSAKIAQALVAYEKTMQQAGSDLATAFGKLMTSLYESVDALALAETVLIAATQNAYSIFWSGVQMAVEQARN